MSKKKFTDGLESLFGPDSKEEISGKGTAFLSGAPSSKNKSGGKTSSSRKNFTTDLDSLLEEALQESFSEKTNSGSAGKKKAKAKPFHQQKQHRPMTGLDVLIRRTVDSGTVQEDKKTGTKRLTVTFDKRKIIKLKKIARIEKAYLKDILGELVDEYIKTYEKEKGNVEKKS